MNPLEKVEKVFLRQRRLDELKRIMTQARSTVQSVIRQNIYAPNLTLTEMQHWRKANADLSKVYKVMDSTWNKYIVPEMEDAYGDAKDIAQRMIQRAGITQRSSVKLSGRVVDALINDSVNKFAGMTEGGWTLANTLFREVQTSAIRAEEINSAIASGLLAEATPERIQSNLEKLIIKDMLVDGKVLAGSKKYTPEAYTEMLARTRVRDAQTAATIDTALEYGVDLVQVSDHNTTTPICMNYEGQIYSISGRNPKYPKLEEVTPFHPNCLHVMLPLPIADAKDESRIQNEANEIYQRNQSKIIQGAA